MKFGLSDENWNILEKILVSPLKVHGATVWVFGSRATGRNRDFSDIDIMYQGHVPQSVLSTIKEHLEESALPITVDIVEESDLAESYRHQVTKERVRV